MIDLIAPNKTIINNRIEAKLKKKLGKKQGLNVFIVCLLFLVILSFSTLAMLFTTMGFAMLKGTFNVAYMQSSLDFNIFSLYNEMCTIILFIAFCYIVQNRKPDSLGFTGSILKNYSIGFLVGLAIFSLIVTTSWSLDSVIIAKSDNIQVGTILLFLGGWLMQGLSEEVMCRGFLLTTLSRRYSVSFSIFISSLIFAALHLFNDGISIISFLNIFMFGVFAALVFIKTNSLWICAAMHSAWNFAQGNIFGISVSGLYNTPSLLKTTLDPSMSIINGGSFGSEGGIATTIILCISCTLVLGLIYNDPKNKLTSRINGFN